MRLILKRCLNSTIRRLSFAHLYQIKRILEPHTKLHNAFTELFAFYPGVLLYFKRRTEENQVFPHQPKELKMLSQEAQQLYRVLQHTSSHHAYRH